MLSTIVSALAGLLGVLIGAFSTHFLHYKNHKSEEIKVINKSIHYLLELFFLINRLNTEKMTSAYFDYYFLRVKKIIPNLDDKKIEVAKEQCGPIIKNSLVPALQKQTYEELQNMGKLYEEMVSNLATILPVTAFYLRGKNNLEILLQTVSKYFEDIKIPDENNAAIISETINQMQPELTADLINEYKDELKSELFTLLKKATWHNRCAGKRTIKGIESIELTESEKRKIDSMITCAVNLVVQSAKAF